MGTRAAPIATFFCCLFGAAHADDVVAPAEIAFVADTDASAVVISNYDLADSGGATLAGSDVSALDMSAADAAVVGVGTAELPVGYVNETKDPWIDRMHNGVFNAVWRSAMRMDRWFGSQEDESA